MNTWNDLANASLDASLFAEFCDILTALADDDAGILCTDEGAESKGVLRRGRLGGRTGGWGRGG